MWYLRVTYKTKDNGAIYSYDLEYDGCHDKKNPQWINDAEKLARENCREDSDIMDFQLIEKDFKYILISSIDNEIYTQFFYDLKEAQEQMELDVACSYERDTYEQINSIHTRGQDFDFDDYNAWCIVDNKKNVWRIDKINN